MTDQEQKQESTNITTPQPDANPPQNQPKVGKGELGDKELEKATGGCCTGKHIS